MGTIKLSIDKHDGEERLFAEFPRNQTLNDLIMQIPGRRWSRSKKKWHFNLPLPFDTSTTGWFVPKGCLRHEACLSLPVKGLPPSIYT